mmetsp:Transcript_28254/g.32063  ORF Transcript_28254/g.32063 Transcript_28254/m.32063 type:complete len:85 (-) Transcript_28254:102-356(-)
MLERKSELYCRYCTKQNRKNENCLINLLYRNRSKTRQLYQIKEREYITRCFQPVAYGDTTFVIIALWDWCYSIEEEGRHTVQIE